MPSQGLLGLSAKQVVPWVGTPQAAFQEGPICSPLDISRARTPPPQGTCCTSCGPCPAFRSRTPPCQWGCHASWHSSAGQLSGRTGRKRRQTARRWVEDPSHTSPAAPPTVNTCRGRPAPCQSAHAPQTNSNMHSLEPCSVHTWLI